MKILFLTDNFPPERNAPAVRTWEHASRWVRDGHEVTVITTAPNFPDGKPLAGYRNRWHATEVIDGIRVVRVKSYITANEGFLRRTLDYVSFMLTGSVAALFQSRPDILISTSPQFFCAVGGWMVSRLRRLPWVFELRDLWPASIVAVGAMQPSRAIRWLEALELRMYRDADLVVAVTNGLKSDLVRRGIDEAKVRVVRNGADVNRFSPRPKDPALATQFTLAGRFVAGYFGTIGMGAGCEALVDAAERLRHRPDILILLAGSGARRQAVEELIRARGLDNIRVLPPVQQEGMPALWSLLDVALVTMKDRPLFASTISSKMFEALAMGLPVVMSMPPGESTGLVDEHGFGLNVAPENPDQMAAALIRLADDAALRARLSAASLRASALFTRERMAALMMAQMQDLVHDNQPDRQARSA